MNLTNKPTVWNGIRFGSVLEARWAIMLENAAGVSKWSYRPEFAAIPSPERTLDNEFTKARTYQPDFVFVVGNQIVFTLEVKPTRVTPTYLDWYRSLVELLPGSALIGQGGFHKACPRFTMVDPTITTDYGCVNRNRLFRAQKSAIVIARHHSFDDPTHLIPRATKLLCNKDMESYVSGF